MYYVNFSLTRVLKILGTNSKSLQRPLRKEKNR
nr:MAG TPA: hypothetical protein [Caudoviricetes sp.]